MPIFVNIISNLGFIDQTLSLVSHPLSLTRMSEGFRTAPNTPAGSGTTTPHEVEMHDATAGLHNSPNTELDDAMTGLPNAPSTPIRAETNANLTNPPTQGTPRGPGPGGTPRGPGAASSSRKTRRSVSF